MDMQKTMKSLLEHKSRLNTLAEIGWHEVKTTTYLKSAISAKPLIGGFGPNLTGLLYKVGIGKRSILLRADIDGLQTSRGVRHTCGHSTHMAALMDALTYTQTQLATLNRGNKSIYFLFQPSEERFPSGANAFIKEHNDIMECVDSAYTIHVQPKLELGVVGLQTGPIWARGDYIEIKVKGKMVHIKDNLSGIDAIHAAALVVDGIKSIQFAHKSIRIGIGIIQGGLQTNTVADYVLLKGDVRIPKETYQKIVKKKLSELLNRITKKTGAQIVLDYSDGTPTVVNNPSQTNKLLRFLKQKTDLPFTYQQSGMFSYGCEDFAYIASHVPSVTAFIGTGDKYDLHEENCTISDQGTLNAAAYFKAVVDWFLQS